MNKRGGQAGTGVFSWQWLLWGGLWLGLSLLLADYSFELFHNAVELLGTVLAGSVFVLAWNVRRYAGGHYLVLLGFSCLSVGGLDATHLLAYGRGADSGLALGLGELRDLTAGLTLLIAALWGHPRLASPLLPLVYGAALLGLAALLYQGALPTPFPGMAQGGEQVISGEVFSSLLLLLAGVVCWRRRASLDRQVWPLLLAAIAAGLVAEQLSILAALRRDPSALGAHQVWLLSFYLIYRALVRVGVERPHAVALRYLQAQQEELEGEKEELEQRLAEQLQLNQLAIEQAGDAVFWITPDGRFFDANEAACRNLGYTREELLALSVMELDTDTDEQGWRAHWQELKARGSVLLVSKHLAKDGRVLTVEITANHIELDGREYNCAFVRDITARRQAEAALLAAERRFRDLLDNVKLAGVLLDLEGRVIYCNDYLLELLGCSRKQALGQDWFELCVPLEQRAEVRRVFTEIVFEGDPEIYRHYEHEVEGAKGQRQLIAWNNTLLRDEQGEIYSVASLGADITSQRQAEAERRRTEALLRALVDHSPAAIFLKDREGRYVLANRPFYQIIGRPSEEVLGKTAADLFSEHIAQPLEEHDQRVLREGGTFRGEEVVHGGDEERVFLAVKFPVTDPQGRISGLGGISTDITEQKHTEELLRRLQALLLNSERLATMGSWEWDFRTQNFNWSPEMYRQYQMAPQEAPHPNLDLVIETIHPEDRARVSQTFERVQQVGCFGPVEYRLVLSDGQVRHFRSEGELVCDARGEPLKLVGFAQDITRQKATELALAQSEAKYRIVADNTYDWEFWLSPEGRFRYCSPSCERLTGYTAAEFTADPDLLASIVHPEDREGFALHHPVRRGVGEMEFRLVARDGQVRWVSHISEPVYDGDGEYLGIRGSNRDITARRQAEEALLQSARLISLGEMAAGIAHELNQPLTVVATLAEGLQIRLEQGMAVPQERQLKWSEEVLAQVERMRRIIDHLRDFSRKRLELPSEVVDLNRVVGSALGLSLAQLKTHGIELRQELAAELPPVLGDPYRLEQVLINLIGNARDALDQRERELGDYPPPDWQKALWVRTRLVEARRDQLEVTVEESAGLRSAEWSNQAGQDWVVVEVEDCGLGISEENQRRLFQPFFTTKEPGVGTGLGLSISYTIMRDHRGRLECRSQLGEGAVFEMWLPVAT
ncbi:MAG: PAS domain S-box protein [Candidatus Latescibacteria bacterium]|nr:PAS domain S-box protein [Candidatus Latescibacterota bacterium]